MTAYSKDAHGNYLIKGRKYERLVGSRAQVNHGTAYKTSGGLKKGDLLQNKNGRIVSRKKHGTAKRENRLVKAGYGSRKGHFGAVPLKTRGKKTRRGKKARGMRGGYSAGVNDNPAYVDDSSSRVGSAAFSTGPYRVSQNQ
jgi:hypothetical protein